AKLRLQLGIVDPDPETLNSSYDIETQTVRAIETQANDARGRTDELQMQFNQIEKLKLADLPVVLPLLNISDPTVAKVLPLYQDAVAEEARLLNGGLGPNHPK